jgi:hypothetical protein
LRTEGVRVGGKRAVKMNQDERHLTWVGFQIREAAARYGKEGKKK